MRILYSCFGSAVKLNLQLMAKDDSFWDDMPTKTVSRFRVQDGVRQLWHFFEHSRKWGWKSLGRVIPKTYKAITVEELKVKLQQQAEAETTSWPVAVRLAWAEGLYQTHFEALSAPPAPMPVGAVLSSASAPEPNLGHELWLMEFGPSGFTGF